MISLTLKRKWLTLRSTIGELYVDGRFECFILEDRYRPPPEVKVPKETCIPIGRYRVLWTFSPRFQRMMLLIDGVPGFEGIRIHAGNTPQHTEGCPCTGTERLPDKVLHSLVALKSLETKVVGRIEAGEECWIDISLDPSPT